MSGLTGQERMKGLTTSELRHITFRVKPELVCGPSHPSGALAVRVKQSLGKSDTDLKPHENDYYNSNLFPLILKRALENVTHGARFLFLDQLPEGVTVDTSKFLAVVRVRISA